jgi:hypothetical protein
MIKGREILITEGGRNIAATTSCEVTLNCEAVPYVPIPGTSEDDGWAHYKYGALSWAVNSSGFYTSDYEMLSRAVSSVLDLQISVFIGADTQLQGTAVMEEVSIVAETGTLTKAQLKFRCNDFPELRNGILLADVTGNVFVTSDNLKLELNGQ